MATWRDYQPEPGDNTAAPPVGAPEGNYRGSVVNDTFRRLMAAVRNLGDTTPKITGAGDPEATIGSMAYQNAGAVAITGGTISSTVAGIVPLRAIVPYGGNLTQAAALAPNWAICDGRTVNGIVTPDLRGLFVRAWSDSVAAGSSGGSFDAITSSSNGAHTHTGSTGSTALTVGQLPAHSHREGGSLAGGDAGLTTAEQNPTSSGYTRPGDYGNQNDSWRWLTEETGSGQGHAHSIGSDGAHTHTVTPVAPPYYALIYIMRTA